LPLPTTVDKPGISVCNAMDTGILPHMDDEESLYFKPNELLLYQHAQDHNSYAHKHTLLRDHNFNVACETGV
jgi:hypothetical protein